MRILKKTIAALTVAVMAVAMLTACSGGSGSGNDVVVPVKKIKYKDSYTAKVMKESYWEEDDEWNNYPIVVVEARKGHNRYTANYYRSTLWMELICLETERKQYDVIYPERPDISHHPDENTEKATVPVYTVEDYDPSEDDDMILPDDYEVEVGVSNGYYTEVIKVTQNGTETISTFRYDQNNGYKLIKMITSGADVENVDLDIKNFSYHVSQDYWTNYLPEGAIKKTY